MTAPILYLTGTNTAVGKTTLACLLLRRARERNLRAAAMKPFCSGGRDDAEKLHALQTAGLTLDEVNPFYFADPVTPLIAARNENRVITLKQTLAAIENLHSRSDPLLIEGAGGLLSPLGDRFTLLDIIQQLPGRICIVAPNVLGVLNSALLTHAALETPRGYGVRPHDAALDSGAFVLMDQQNPDASSSSNGEILRAWTNAPTHEFPFQPPAEISNPPPSATSVLDALLNWWLGENSQKSSVVHTQRA
jgi:dethiobiotin synthetase